MSLPVRSAHDAFFCADRRIFLSDPERVRQSVALGRRVFGVRFLGYRPARMERWVVEGIDAIIDTARTGWWWDLTPRLRVVGMGPISDRVEEPYPHLRGTEAQRIALDHMLAAEATARDLEVQVAPGAAWEPPTRDAFLLALSMDRHWQAADRLLHVASCPKRPGYRAFGAVDPVAPRCPLCDGPLRFGGVPGDHPARLHEAALEGELPAVVLLEPLLRDADDASWLDDPWGLVALLPVRGAERGGTITSWMPAVEEADPAATIRSFRLGAPLHSGLTATRWQAWPALDGAVDQDAGVCVALGHSPLNMLSPALLQELDNEVRAFEVLRHPAIPHLLEWGPVEVDGVAYHAVVTEPWQGPDLRAALSFALRAPDDDGFWRMLPVAASLEIIRQLAALLRDLGRPTGDRPAWVLSNLGPDSVFVDGTDGRVLVADLRLGGPAGSPAPAGIRLDPFRHPDLVAGSPLDPAFDTWSLANLAVELLTSEELRNLGSRRRRGSQGRWPDAADGEISAVLEEGGRAPGALPETIRALVEGDAAAQRAALATLADLPQDPAGVAAVIELARQSLHAHRTETNLS